MSVDRATTKKTESRAFAPATRFAGRRLARVAPHRSIVKSSRADCLDDAPPRRIEASCERPDRLKNIVEPEVFEIWSGGRLMSARPEVCGGAIIGCSGTDTIFKGTKYDYLARGDRLTHRFATIIGDTTRALAVLIAASHPPVAAGLVQETVYLHSGELETGNVDLDAGGRNGWNVAFDRTYHFRTMVPGFLGLGWSSLIFRSVRALPNGNVEYRTRRCRSSATPSSMRGRSSRRRSISAPAAASSPRSAGTARDG